MNPVITFFIRLLEMLFIIGCVGSVIVIFLSGVEDVETILSSGEEEHSAPTQAKT